MVAAANACRMKSNSNMLMLLFVRLMSIAVTVRVVLQLVSARHHEDAVLEPQHLDLRAIEAREHGCGDHLIDGAERRVSPAEVEHPIERSEQRIELMRAEQHCDAELSLQRFNQGDDVALMRRIETHQGLIQQQQLRLPD